MTTQPLPPELVGDERYRLLVESVTDYAIYLLDPTGVIVSWNAGARRFKGYEADEIIGSHFSRFYTDEDKARGLPERALETARREGRFEAEGWRVRKDGTLIWTHVVIDPVLRPSGEVIGYAKITRDLTERREADLALRQSEERFRLLVQGVTDYAIYMLDPEGFVTNWNPGAQRIKQYTADEIVGQHFSRFYSEEDRLAGVPQQALATARNEGRFREEGWRVRKDGTRFWANVVIDPIRNDAGDIIGFAKVTRDITERLEAQQALTEQAQEALFQSQKMEAIGQLTGGVAHDFNNLLAAVMGGLELLAKRHADDPKSAQLIEQSLQGARRGVSLTQRMLAFARRQELKPEAVDVPELVDGISEMLKRTLGPDFTLELDFPGDLPAAHTDANQLELAIFNLTVNARDAMPEGGVIRIAAHTCKPGDTERDLSGDADFLCLAIIDAGVGMDANTLARATEPFFTTKGVGKGTGLGLSMVQGLAAQLGGRLRLASEKGRGTTAELLLPLADEAPIAKHEPPATADMSSTQSLRILAVDDDALILMNTAAMLEDMGHTVHEAASGTAALETLARESVDLVITDQAMPRMKGTELIAELHKSYPALPIILATGYAELPEDLDKTILRLAKPFSQRDLMLAIGKVMSGSTGVVSSKGQS